MPFWEQEVKIPAVNYRGARKIRGATTRKRSVHYATDIPKMEHIIGNTPGRLGRSRLQELPSFRCCTVFIPPIHHSRPVFMRYYSNYYRNLSLICR